MFLALLSATVMVSLITCFRYCSHSNFVVVAVSDHILSHSVKVSTTVTTVGARKIDDEGNPISDVTDVDHCITSADCAFNGECIKITQAETTLFDGRHKNKNYNTEARVDPEAPGLCDCFPGWKGRTCEVLDLLPVDPKRIGLKLPDRNSSTWGGSVVYYEDQDKDNTNGLYHMFASEIIYNCGLSSWTTNSQVIRAVSESPYGPYRKVQVILPTFAHDANIIRAPTGEFVLYVTALRGIAPKDCRHSSDAESVSRLSILHQMHGSNTTKMRHLREPLVNGSKNDDHDIPPKDTYMLWAPKPEGPWSEPVMVLNSTIYNSDYWKKFNKTAKCDSNLNGIILPSRSSGGDHNALHRHDDSGAQPFLGLWRRCETEDLLTIPHALLASDWKNASTYAPLAETPLFVLAGSGAEDPSNIWTTQTSDMKPGEVAYHALFHDEQATRCMIGSCGGQGRHAVSLDGTTWKYANVNAYDRHFMVGSNSSVLTRADTRARPHIILAPSTATKSGTHRHQRPVALSTGIKETDEDGYVYTLVQPLNTE